MHTPFRQRVASGEALFGTMVTLNSPAAAEILSHCGFDWLFIDAEHGPFETPDLCSLIQAVGGRTACVVRVPVAEEGHIKRVLDIGANGVIAPQVNSAEHAERVVRYSRYAPEGSRGVGLGRAHGYGFQFQDYLDSANESVAVIVQAEHVRAVESIESICAVEGIDAILLGPYDLAASLGRMGQVDHPDVVGAIDQVTQECQRRGISLGMFGVTAEAVQPYIEKGYSLIVAGVDTLFLGNGAKKILSKVRGE